MAAATALANRQIVSIILLQLSNMKYKDRRQRGPDEPVELLEFRPTLIPSILVNRLWADEGTSILWMRYPHLPALRDMAPERKQYYANKVSWIFCLSPPPGHAESLDYLDGLQWPNLKVLEMEIDFNRHGAKFLAMLHSGLEQLELSGFQSGGAAYFKEVTLPSLLRPCSNLRSLTLGPGVVPDDEPIPSTFLCEYIEALRSLETVHLKNAGFSDPDSLFVSLRKRAGLRSLEISLDPGLSLLPPGMGQDFWTSSFSSLTNLDIMCYPEIAMALVPQLPSIRRLQLDICRIPEHPIEESDYVVIDDIISAMSDCSRLRSLKLGLGPLALDFPSEHNLPRLSGGTLIRLSKQFPSLEELNLFASEPSALDASSISREEFEEFCQGLPHIRILNLKLDPKTSSSLAENALISLGKHCHHLELLRLRIPCLLTKLPVHSNNTEATLASQVISGETLATGVDSCSVATLEPTILPLFPRLSHLGIARPDTALFDASDSATPTSEPYSTILDPDEEAEIVRIWAVALLTHFPQIEILEAWSDWTGRDNESLNYFLPSEEVLASTWEFLSGVEQDLWEDDLAEDESWQALESSDDWDAASYLNEFPAEYGHAWDPVYVEEEPEDMVTRGRTVHADSYFQQENTAEALPDKFSTMGIS